MIRSVLTGALLAAGIACLPGSASAQSFRATCPNVWQTGPILHANCLNIYGGLVQSSIDLRSCPRESIGNTNGQLTCGDSYGGGYGGGYGGPRYRRGW